MFEVSIVKLVIQVVSAGVSSVLTTPPVAFNV
jgi:hypothetical protein